MAEKTEGETKDSVTPEPAVNESERECEQAKKEEEETVEIEKPPENSNSEEADSEKQSNVTAEEVKEVAKNDEALEGEVKQDTSGSKEDISVGEAIEEPVMHITGEGNGAECESPYYLGEEIEEPIMFFWGEGSGYENNTGNPDVVQQNSSEENTSKSKSGDRSNGECVSDLSDPAKLGSSIKLRSSQISVAKRTLKTPSNDSIDPLKSDPKKHCVRDLEKSDSSSSVNNDKSTSNSECVNSNKQNKRKTKSKVKKNSAPPRKIKLQEGRDVSNTTSSADHCSDSKSTIIEKRKSSISSSDHDENDNTDNEKESSISPEKEMKVKIKVEETLPPKKLKLEKTPDTNDKASPTKANDEEFKEQKAQQKNGGTEESTNSVLQRKTIKASRGKFKRKKLAQKQMLQNDKKEVKQEESDTKQDSESPKKRKSKSLKRSLIDACQSDKNKTESQSESEEEEQATLGKRLKFKPKKISSSTR